MSFILYTGRYTDHTHAAIVPGLPCAIFDLDGVLVNNRDRVNRVFAAAAANGEDEEQVQMRAFRPHEWQMYNELAHLDKPTQFMGVPFLLRAAGAVNVVIVTARPATEHQATVDQLDEWGLPARMYEMYMRADPTEPSHLYKEKVVNHLRFNRMQQIAFAIDDERGITDMYVRNGVTALRMMNLVNPNMPDAY